MPPTKDQSDASVRVAMVDEQSAYTSSMASTTQSCSQMIPRRPLLVALLIRKGCGLCRVPVSMRAVPMVHRFTWECPSTYTPRAPLPPTYVQYRYTSMSCTHCLISHPLFLPTAGADPSGDGGGYRYDEGSILRYMLVWRAGLSRAAGKLGLP